MRVFRIFWGDASSEVRGLKGLQGESTPNKFPSNVSEDFLEPSGKLGPKNFG